MSDKQSNAINVATLLAATVAPGPLGVGPGRLLKTVQNGEAIYVVSAASDDQSLRISVSAAIAIVEKSLGPNAPIGMAQGKFLKIMRSGEVRSGRAGLPLQHDHPSFWQNAVIENGEVVHLVPGNYRGGFDVVSADDGGIQLCHFHVEEGPRNFRPAERRRSLLVSISQDDLEFVLRTGVSGDDLMFYCRHQDKSQGVAKRVVRSDTTGRSVCPSMIPPVTSGRGTSPEEEPLSDDNPLVVRSAKLRMLGQLVELVKADAQGRSPAVPIDDLDFEQVAKLPKAERDARDRRFDRLNGRGKEGVTTRLRKQFGGKQDHWEALFDEIFGLVRAEIPPKGRPSEATRVKMEQVAEEWIERLAA